MSQVKNLVKTWPDFKLNIPSWEIPDHGVSVLWGPSGSGKSSALRIMCGLDDCKAFQWIWTEKDIMQLTALERNLGVVFQNYDLFPHMTARQNILFPLQVRKMAAEDSELNRLVTSLDIQSIMDRKASVLSGGEQQRVALARALVFRPRMLLLDEPFAALDEKLKASSRQLVKELIQKLNIPCLLITHDKRDVEELAQNVFEIYNGQLIN